MQAPHVIDTVRGSVREEAGGRRARAAHYFSAVGPAELGTGVGGVSPPAATLHFTAGPTRAHGGGSRTPCSLGQGGRRALTLTHGPRRLASRRDPRTVTQCSSSYR